MGNGLSSSAVPKVTIQRAPKKSSLSTLLVKPLEEVRPALPVGIPPFREGKHRVRLYAGRSSGALPRTPVFAGSYEEGVFMRKEKKTEIITLRVTPQTKDRIRAKAQELGLTVTDYLCLCGLGKKIVRVEGLDQVLSELKAQGRNLNQLTTLANMGKIAVVYGDRLAEGYAQISEQLRQLLREVT